MSVPCSDNTSCYGDRWRIAIRYACVVWRHKRQPAPTDPSPAVRATVQGRPIRTTDRGESAGWRRRQTQPNNDSRMGRFHCPGVAHGAMTNCLDSGSPAPPLLCSPTPPQGAAS